MTSGEHEPSGLGLEAGFEFYRSFFRIGNVRPVEESLRRLVHLYRKTDLSKPDEFLFAPKSKELFDVVVFVHTGCLFR